MIKKIAWPAILITTLIIFIISLSGLFFYKKFFHKTEFFPKESVVVDAVYGLGTVMAARKFEVKPGVNQTIKEYFVVEGQTVKQGAPMVQFVGSQIIRAPFEGIISSLPFQKSENVFPQVTVLELVDLSQLYLEVSLEQQMIVRVRKGQKVKVSFDHLRGEHLEASVYSIYPRDNQFIVKVIPSYFPTGILPGMTADTAIEIETRSHAMLVPLGAIKNNRMITRMRDGKTEQFPVELGAVIDDWVEVKSPELKSTDRLIGE